MEGVFYRSSEGLTFIQYKHDAFTGSSIVLGNVSEDLDSSFSELDVAIGELKFKNDEDVIINVFNHRQIQPYEGMEDFEFIDELKDFSTMLHYYVNTYKTEINETFGETIH